MNSSFVTLMKREFWEHRSLWIAPLVAAVFLVGATLVGAFFAAEHMGVRPPLRFNGMGGSPEFRSNVMLMSVMGVAGLVMLAAAMASFTYLLDSLFSERKDRSILFWKSLPVSDAHTVLAKLVVAMAVVPALAFVLVMVTHLLVSAIMAVATAQLPAIAGGWHFGAWVDAQVKLLGMLVATQLWYVPFAAWYMLASVTSRRAPILMALLPPVALGVAENVLFRTGHVWQFLGYRLRPRTNLWEALLLPDLWLGLAAAAGMLYIVIRLRRYRDDT